MDSEDSNDFFEIGQYSDEEEEDDEEITPGDETNSTTVGSTLKV